MIWLVISIAPFSGFFFNDIIYDFIFFIKFYKILENTEKISKILYSLDEVRAKVYKSAIKILCYDFDGVNILCQGSGFFINTDGVFITNAHVVKNACYITIEDFSGRTYNVNTVYEYNYEGSDYAVCKAENCKSQPAEFEEHYGVGDTVYALGFPDGATNLVGTEGEILRINVVDDGIKYIENSAVINFGSSGSPLLNAEGKVIALATGAFGEKEFAAIPYNEFKTALEKDFSVGKTPLETFYGSYKLNLNPDNFRLYFELEIIPNYDGDVSVSYDVKIKLKQKYAKMDYTASGGFSLSVDVITYAKWTGSPGSGVFECRNNLLTQFSAEEIESGKNAGFTARLDLPNDTPNLEIYFEAQIVSATGEIIFEV